MALWPLTYKPIDGRGDHLADLKSGVRAFSCFIQICLSQVPVDTIKCRAGKAGILTAVKT